MRPGSVSGGSSAMCHWACPPPASAMAPGASAVLAEKSGSSLRGNLPSRKLVPCGTGAHFTSNRRARVTMRAILLFRGSIALVQAATLLIFGLHVDSDVIAGGGKAGVSSTTRTTEKLPSSLDAVSDHLAAAVHTHRRQLVNRAFETVEDMPISCCDHFKTQRVIVAADFTFSHVL